jgi:branched-chain amino acid transport system substrate-binding protein
MSSRARWALIAVAVVAMVAAVIYVTTARTDAPSATGPVKVGSILILSGQYASYGEQFRDGASLAVARANEEGSARPIEIRFMDSGGAKEKAREILRTMHDRDGIRYLADIMGSPLTLDAAPEFTKLRMLTLSGTSTAPDLSWKGGPYFFRVVPSDGAASEQASTWALSRGFKRAVVLHDTDDWGSGLTSALERVYTAAGGEIAARLQCAKGFQLFPSLVSQVAAAKPDVVFLFVYPREAGLFLKEARAAKLAVPVIGTDNFTGSEMRDLAGDALEGAMYVLPASSSKGGRAYDDLVHRYRAKTGRTDDPPLFVVTGYDVATILADVARRFGDDTTAAAEYLRKTTFDGASGKIAFTKTGDPAVQSYQRLVVQRTDDGTLKAVPVAQ